jgi:hypothetical protein
MYDYQTPEEAKKRIFARNKEAALAWLEQVGSWPSDDPEVQEVTILASRLLRFPVPNPMPVSWVEGLVTAGLAAVGLTAFVLGLRQNAEPPVYPAFRV